mmetsp:Transcript_2526/g.5632  ORF Transcript_2526/g.5632 Transcript_2526/m.5632 type:complete len:557 (-) Transcript_2526:79-1749(-)
MTLARRPRVFLLCLLCALPSFIQAQINKEELHARIADISQRAAWTHKPVLPEEVIERSWSFIGDYSRLKLMAMKLVLGIPVHLAHMGGSISQVFFWTGKTETDVPKDVTWHAIFHKWLELAFTPCGKNNNMSSRDPDVTYGIHTHICPQSNIKLHNLATGGTSSIFGEKCIVQKVNSTSVDMLLLEYTQNSLTDDILFPADAYDAQERKSLERLFRKALKMPSRPAVVMLHSYNNRYIAKFGLIADDWHNLVALHYGNVQVISVRNAVHHLWRKTGGNLTEIPAYMFDGVHLSKLGHYLWADIMISMFKRVALRVMGDLLLEATLPGVAMAPPGPLAGTADGVQLPPALQEYAANWNGMPAPLHPGNEADSDGACLVSDDLQSAAKAVSGGFKWSYDVSRQTGQRKYGFIGNQAGATLELEFDSTVNGVLGSASAEAAQKNRGNQPAGVFSGNAQVLIGYLASYSSIGKARAECSSGCTCEKVTVDAKWDSKMSQTTFFPMVVSPHRNCTIKITVLDTTKERGISRFKVSALVISTRGSMEPSKLGYAMHYNDVAR